MACPGFPWTSSAPEQHLSWQVHLRPPFPRSRCESGGQNSSAPRSWSGRSVSSSSSAGVSLPHSSPVCARIHSCSPLVPVSLRRPRPHRALALEPGPPAPHSSLGSLSTRGRREESPRTLSWTVRPAPQTLRKQQGRGLSWAGGHTVLFLGLGTLGAYSPGAGDKGTLLRGGRVKMLKP